MGSKFENILLLRIVKMHNAFLHACIFLACLESRLGNALANSTAADVTTYGSVCPDGPVKYAMFGSMCLAYFPKVKAWTAARDHCRNLRPTAELVKITSKQQNDYITSIINGSSWIGLNDRETRFTFRWADGTDPSYTNWALYQPDGGGPIGKLFLNEDCVNIQTDGLWNDNTCYKLLPYVCLMEKGTGDENVVMVTASLTREMATEIASTTSPILTTFFSLTSAGKGYPVPVAVGYSAGIFLAIAIALSIVLIIFCVRKRKLTIKTLQKQLDAGSQLHAFPVAHYENTDVPTAMEGAQDLADGVPSSQQVSSSQYANVSSPMKDEIHADYEDLKKQGDKVEYDLPTFYTPLNIGLDGPNEAADGAKEYEKLNKTTVKEYEMTSFYTPLHLK